MAGVLPPCQKEKTQGDGAGTEPISGDDTFPKERQSGQRKNSRWGGRGEGSLRGHRKLRAAQLGEIAGALCQGECQKPQVKAEINQTCWWI